MKNNNGKIAIAVVAMFVIALAVIGFTYAYFVASVTGNTNQSVVVNAGILEVAYANNQSKQISVANIVPGWKSDGLHYFDPEVYTNETVTIDGEQKTVHAYTAQVAASEAVLPEGALGVSGPAEFSVTNNSTATNPTASYVVMLNGVTNSLAVADQENFTYALCVGTCPTGEYSTLTVGTDNVISKGVFPGTGWQVISDVRTLTTKGANETYNLMLYYAETNEIQDSMNAILSATVDIVGVQQAEEDGAWYDANGVQIIAAS